MTVGERRAIGLAVERADGVDVGDVVGERPVVADAEPAHLAGPDGDGGRCDPQAAHLVRFRVARRERDAVVAQEPARERGRDQDHRDNGKRGECTDRRSRMRW